MLQGILLFSTQKRKERKQIQSISTINMHTKVNFLILILVTLSYYQLLNPLSVEARTLASQGQTFTIDLIHRDSRHYNPSITSHENQKRSILGSISYNHHFHLSSKYYDHEMSTSASTIGTEVIPNGGSYLLKIAIGTPPIELTAVVDTGSDLLWVQCTPCQQCIPQEEPLFDPTKSSSYKTIPCNSKSCNYPDFESACIPNNSSSSCVYNAQYGDGTSSLGVLATDTLTFTTGDSMATFPSSTFGCGFNQKGRFGIHGDGIIGLGAGDLSLVSQLGSSINHKFAYCLTPLSSGVNGKLKFGSNAMVPGAVSTPLVNLDPSNVFYYLTLDGISIQNSSIAAGQDVIIDCGTTLTFLKDSVYDGVKNAVKNAIKLEPVPDPNQVFDPCYKAEQTGEGFNPPDMVFHFKGADIVLKSINTFRTLRNLTCLAMVPTGDTFIFGNIAQVNFEVGYDLGAKQVSFAPTDCSKY